MLCFGVVAGTCWVLYRFYMLFEAIYKYVTDLNKVLQDIEEGIRFLQYISAVLHR